MASKKIKIEGDRSVTITGRLAMVEPSYTDGEVAESDAGFASHANTYSSGIIVKPDGSLALQAWPPAVVEEEKEEDTNPDGTERTDQDKAVAKSETLKGNTDARRAPILKI